MATPEGPAGFRARSRADWCPNDGDKNTPLDRDQIHLGAVLRIADASEAMAQHHVAILKERDNLQARVEDLIAQCDREWQQNLALGRRITALRGVITRMKKARS
jgi:hypothetical protein